MTTSALTKVRLRVAAATVFVSIGLRAEMPGPAGPDAAVAFELSYRGDTSKPAQLHCYPDAKAIPFSDTEHIIPLSPSLWTPADLVADFQRRQKLEGALCRKKGILVLLKSERCATKEARFCSVATAALEKASTPLARDFEIYGVQLLPRDGDTPPGHLAIETGVNAWKNQAAGQYGFVQGPGAAIVFLNPRTGAVVGRSDALRLHLEEPTFLAHHGRAPELEALMVDVLARLEFEQLGQASLAGGTTGARE
jgi:hypothetical protein